MQAITTSYYGPTNYRASYLKVKCQAGSVRVEYDHALSIQDNHRAACEALLRKLGWTAPRYAPMVGGQVESEDYVWVFTGELSPRAQVQEQLEKGEECRC